MLTNYKLLLEFPGEFQRTDSCAKGTWLSPSAPLTLYVWDCVSFGLGSILSKHAFDTQEVVAPVWNRDIVSLLLTVTKNVLHILYYFTCDIEFSIKFYVFSCDVLYACVISQ